MCTEGLAAAHERMQAWFSFQDGLAYMWFENRVFRFQVLREKKDDYAPVEREKSLSSGVPFNVEREGASDVSWKQSALRDEACFLRSTMLCRRTNCM